MLYQQINRDKKMAIRNANWKDSCFNVTLGACSIKGTYDDSKAVYGLVWEVTPENYSYPECIVNAHTGDLIGYSDGIIVF